MRSSKRFGISSGFLIASWSLSVCVPARAETADILSGKWEWQATCDHGEFHGIMEIKQQDTAFTGQFLETNFWDKGTI
jgi:hypothetical protein